MEVFPAFFQCFPENICKPLWHPSISGRSSSTLAHPRLKKAEATSATSQEWYCEREGPMCQMLLSTSTYFKTYGYLVRIFFFKFRCCSNNRALSRSMSEPWKGLQTAINFGNWGNSLWMDDRRVVLLSFTNHWTYKTASGKCHHLHLYVYTYSKCFNMPWRPLPETMPI